MQNAHTRKTAYTFFCILQLIYKGNRTEPAIILETEPNLKKSNPHIPVAGKKHCENIIVCVQDDYRRTITELDEKEFISLRLVIIEMRNHYVRNL